MNQSRNTSGASTPPWAMIQAVLRGQRRTLFVAFVVALMPLLYVAWKKGAPSYVSQAAIHVAPRPPKILEEDTEQQAGNYAYFLQQQVYVITRFEVIQEALKRLDPATRARWQQPEESDTQAVERLQRELEVEAIQGSYLVTVALRSYEPEGLADIVTSVVDTYLDVQRGEYIYEPEGRLSELESYRNEIQVEITEKMARKSELAQRLGVSHFASTRANPYDLSLLETRTALNTARTELAVAQLELEALAKEQQRALELEVDSEAELLMSNTAALQEQGPLLGRLDQLLAASAGLTPHHPGYDAALAEIETIKSTMERASEESTQRLAAALDRRRRTEAARARLEAEALAHRAQQKVMAFEQALTQLNDQAAVFIADFAEGLELEDDIARRRSKIAAIDERVSFLTIESAAPGSARLASQARTPEEPEKDRRVLFGIASIIVAGFVGLGAAIVVHVVDNHVQTPADAQLAAGFAPLGWVVDSSDRASQRRADDQLRRLALSIEREHRNSGTRTFVITSPRETPVSAAFIQRLGETLANLELRTLTVDADASRGATGNDQAGLLGVLRGSVEPISAIVRGAPDHLPLGDDSDGAHLPEGHRVGAVLQLLAHDYDVLLVEAPPLTASSDADLLVDHGDAVLLLVQAGRDTTSDVTEAVRTLKSVAPSAVGMIVHGVDPWIQWTLTDEPTEQAAPYDGLSDPLALEEVTA